MRRGPWKPRKAKHKTWIIIPIFRNFARFAGFTNPTVRLFVRAVGSSPSTSANVELFPPSDHGLGDDYIVGNVRFRDDDALLVIWTNRVQNESVVSLCDLNGDGTCYVNLRENALDGWSWVVPKSALFLALDGSTYFMVRVSHCLLEIRAN